MQVFSFRYWKSGGTVKKTPCIKGLFLKSSNSRWKVQETCRIQSGKRSRRTRRWKLPRECRNTSQEELHYQCAAIIWNSLHMLHTAQCTNIWPTNLKLGIFAKMRIGVSALRIYSKGQYAIRCLQWNFSPKYRIWILRFEQVLLRPKVASLGFPSATLPPAALHCSFHRNLPTVLKEGPLPSKKLHWKVAGVDLMADL